MACLPLPVIAQTMFNAPDDIAAIKALEQKNAEQLDAAILAKTFAPDAVVLDYMAGGVYLGRPAIEKAMAPLMASVKSLSANIREHNIVTDGSFACVMLTTDLAFESRDGKTGKVSLRQMDALRKIDGVWQVVQQQVAALSDAKTGMAVMNDLKVRGDAVWGDLTNSEKVSMAQAHKEIETWTHVSMRAIGIDAILPYYGPNDEQVMIYAPTSPGNIRGKAEMRAYYAPYMKSFKNLETATPVLKIDTDGVLGAQIDMQDITLHLHDGKTQPFSRRQSDCVRRVGGTWYGIMSMASFPTDLKTGKSDSKWSEFPVDAMPMKQP